MQRSSSLRTGCFWITSIASTLANGGGYLTGGVEGAGSIDGFQPQHVRGIRMATEALTIKLGAEEAVVDVRYVLKNLSDKPTEATFGFPMEETFKTDFMGKAAREASDADTPVGLFRDYRIESGGRTLPVKWHGESLHVRKQDGRRTIAGWQVSTLDFGPKAEQPLQISFTAPYSRAVDFVSDDSWTSAAVFRYRLSSAACWAETIGKGRIVIQPDGIDPEDVRILKPVNRFRREGNQWVWAFENLEPTFADDIEIEAVPESRIYAQRMTRADHAKRQDDTSERDGYRLLADYVESNGRFTMIHSNYEVKTSSTLESRQPGENKAENLRGRWGQENWVEGAKGSGAGEWIELTPEVPKPLLAVHIESGDYEDHREGEKFGDHPRPKKVRITLNDEFGFEAEIPHVEKDIPVRVKGYDKPARKIRIEILEVYPGKASDHLRVNCVRLQVAAQDKSSIQTGIR